jgi:glutathione peroxidase
VYDVLTETSEAEGRTGNIQWDFEKFVIGADGRVLGRFRPRTEPDAPEVRDCIQRALNAD